MTKNFISNIKIKNIARLTLLCFSVLAVIGFSSLKNLKTLYSVMQFLPAHHPALLMDNEVRTKFKLEDRPTFIGLVELQEPNQNWLSLRHMDELSALIKKIEKMNGVVQAISIANAQGAAELNKTITVGKISSITPISQWKDRFLNDKLLSPTLLSKDARTAMIYVLLENANVDLLKNFEIEFRQTLTHTFPKAKTTVGGVPAVQTDLAILLNSELRNFIILTLIACTLTLFIIFRTLSSMLIPLILTGFSNLMVFSMMAYTGLAFTVLSSTIPILVFIAVVSISIHVMLRVDEDAKQALEHKKILTKWKLILNANKAILLPNLLGSLTTCVGFMTLLVSDVSMIREYGIGVAGAVVISWALTSIGILPLLILFPMPAPREWVKKPARWTLWVLQNRKWILSTITVISLIALFLGKNLYWTARLFDDLPKNQEARQSTEIIDNSMGGIVPMEMSIELPQTSNESSDWSDPKRINNLDLLLKNLRALPGVGTAKSLPDFLRASGLNGARLPNTRGAIAEIYLLYSFSSNNPLVSYLTPDSHSARVELMLHDIPADQAKLNQEAIHRLATQYFPDAKIQTGGMGAVIHIIQHEISRDLIFGFWQALVIILIMLAIVFRSVRWSLVAALPNLIPPILLLGYLAITHTPIKPSVAIIFSIALGLAFNNTVYLLNRLRSFHRSNNYLPIRRAFYLEGNPCLVSTLVVMMGFSVFLFSYFSLNRIFGSCMLVAIIAGLIGDLIFLPALLRMFPRLLLPKAKPKA